MISKTIYYYPVYAKITKTLQGGILLSQLMDWFYKRNKICKTNEDFKQELFLTEHQLRTAKKAIKKLPFINVTREQISAKTFYEIDWKKYKKFMNDFLTK